VGLDTLQLPPIKSFFGFLPGVPEKQNPTSQIEKRGPCIQLMATSILGWRMVYLNIVDNSVSDLIIVGQTKFWELAR